MKKKMLGIYCVIVLLFVSCPSSHSPGGKPDDNPVIAKYAKEFLGEWIRMDTGERWYISENSIKVNGAAFSKTVTLTRSSAQVLTVKESGKADYFLFASRIANGSFNAKVVLIDEGTISPNSSMSRAAIPKGGFIVMPPNNPGLQQPVYPNPITGEIVVPDIIPGDPVEIIPLDPDWKDINVGITPWDGQDMGIIPLAKGVNLKTTIRMANPSANIAMLYADGVAHDFIIEVENIGTTNTTGASYELIMQDSENDIDFYRDFILRSGSTDGLLDTIRPGEKRQLSFSLGSRPITEGRRDKKIGIRITSWDTQVLKTKVWDDTISINYYKTRVPFRFRSEKPVQGVIKAPGGTTYYFKTEGQDGNYSYSIDVPWSSEDYVIAFLGASVDSGSETRYSLAIDDQPPSNWASLVGANLFMNEPANDGENTAPVLDLETNRKFMGYLHDGDIDFYRVKLGSEPPELKIVDMEEWAIGETYTNYLDGNANPGDTVNLDFMFKNYSGESRTLTMTGLAADSAYASYFQLVNLPSSQLYLPPNHYGSLTDYNTNTASNWVQMLNNNYLYQAFQFSLSPDSPPGAITLTLSFQDNAGIGYVKTISFDVVEPAVKIELDSSDEAVPAGTSNLNVKVKNTGTGSTEGVWANLQALESAYRYFITIYTDHVSIGTLAAGGVPFNAAFQIYVDSYCPAGTVIPLRIEFSNDDNNTWHEDFSIIVLPPGPSNVKAEALSETSIRISWDAVTGATGYKVYRDSTLLGTVGSAVLQYEHTGLDSGTIYNYQASSLVSGYESVKIAAAAKTMERLVFNRQYSGAVSEGVPQHYRFYVTSGASYGFTSNSNYTVRWEDNKTEWFSASSGSSNQTANKTGWARFELTNADAYSFRVVTNETAVSSFTFPGLSSTGPGFSESDKNVTLRVDFGTDISSLTPSVIPAFGWSNLTTGAQNFNAPVEYIFSNDIVSQVYLVTITPDGQGGININPPPPIGDETILGFPVSGFTISRSGSGEIPMSLSFTLSSTGYSLIEWWVGVDEKSSEATNNRRTFVVQASAYTLGEHTLTVIAYINGVPYSSSVGFTVVQ